MQMITGDTNSMFENEQFLEQLLTQERNRRIKYEGNPSENLIIITKIDGTKYKIRENGKIWDINEPCVSCNKEECFHSLVQLSKTESVLTEDIQNGTNDMFSPVYNSDIPLCKNPQNDKLLHMLCSWRKHVKDTSLVTQSFGSDKWKRRSICTSELTFLGRNTAIGGIIGIVSLTNKSIDSLASLVSLMEKEPGIHNGVKCLSVGFALLITMYMGWDLYTHENVIIVERLLKKIKSGGLVGLNTFSGSPWYAMFKCVLERRRMPDILKEMILSRAHLP